MYRAAFGVEKVSEDCPDGAAHIGIEVNGFFILLRREEEPVAAKYPFQGCCARLAAEEDLRRAYDLLAEAGKKGELLQDVGWTTLVAWVTDRYGVSWMLCV